MTNVPSVISFANDVSPLFRAKDVSAMRRFFDLSNYADVRAHAEAILARLSNGSMPCDGQWPQDRVGIFRGWMEGGYNP
jgi:hypothetical protein